MLTVITPTYNRGSYLAETIQSVLDQGIDRLEYIILDDGSQDDTSSVVRKYLSKRWFRRSRARVRYIRHENIGETRTVNAGLAMVRTEFFTVVNSDDPLLPGSLQKVVGALRSRPDALAAYPDWEVIDEDSIHVATIRVGAYDIGRMLTEGQVPIGPGACFRRAALDAIGFRNPLLRHSADLDYWFRLALHGPLVHVPEVLATHRVHPSSGSVSHRGTRFAEETAFLLAGYARHPLLPRPQRRYRALADAYGNFAAMFTCSSLLEAERRLLQGLMAHPAGMIGRCEAHGWNDVIGLFTQLGAAPRTGKAERWFARMLQSKDRATCFAAATRGVLSDPLGMIALAQIEGAVSLTGFVKKLPRRQFR